MKKIAVSFALPLIISSISAQPWVPMTPGQYMGSRAIGVLGDLAAVIGELATNNQAIENEVVSTRVAFFNTPEGPARAETARKFDEALMKRDLHYIAQRIVNSARQGAPLLVLTTELAGSHRVDGGLSPYSYQTFKAWADAVINSVSFKSPLEKALKDAMPQFEAYRAERDIVELLFYSTQSPLRAPQARPAEYLAAWLLGTKDAKTFETANTSAANIARQVGPQRLAQIVDVLKSWSTVDNHIAGPWGASPRLALDPLIAGSPGELHAFEAAAHRITFAETRSSFTRYHTNFVPQLEEIEKLWNEGRVNKELETLRLVVEKRDELGGLIRAAQSQKGWEDVGRAQADLMLSQLHSSLSFVDAALKMTELNAMKAGKLNPRAEQAATVTREYLARSSKLQIKTIEQRIVEERQRANAAPARAAPTTTARTPSSQANTARTPPSAASTAADLGTPFDRAIEMAGRPDFQDGYPQMILFNLAKSWEYWTTTTNRGFGWQHELDNIVTGVEHQIIQQQNFLKALELNLAKMVPAQRQAYEKNLGKRDSLRREFLAELERVLPKVKETVAEIKQKP